VGVTAIAGAPIPPLKRRDHTQLTREEDTDFSGNSSFVAMVNPANLRSIFQGSRVTSDVQLMPGREMQ
jgi:hypothetical protein